MATGSRAGVNPAIQPYPLTPAQRLGVGQYRALMALLTPVDLEFDSHPPCFIACGTHDRLAESSRLAHERLKASRAALRFAQYEGEGHGFFSASWRPNSARLRRDIADFLDGV